VTDLLCGPDEAPREAWTSKSNAVELSSLSESISSSFDRLRGDRGLDTEHTEDDSEESGLSGWR
jgi:hypothetical protein